MNLEAMDDEVNGGTLGLTYKTKVVEHYPQPRFHHVGHSN